MTTIYCAKWVLPITSPPIPDGAIVTSGAQIVGIGPSDELKRKFPLATISDFDEAAILPGLVNAHSHLELTVMRGFLEREENDFFAWLQKLTFARNQLMTPEDRFVSALWGASEAARAGVTTLGDACDMASEPLRALNVIGLRGIVYQEVFGPDVRLAQEKFENLREKVARARPSESELARLGVSPHAVYTVSAPLFEAVSEYALAERLPLMVHAAESEAEERFMRAGEGPFAESLRERGVEWRPPGVSSIEYLARCGVLRARPVLAHCIRIDERDAETLSEWQAGVAHCPKSNAKFGHGRAPLALLLAAGIRVGIGSDSVASNNGCDLLEEARFAALTSRAAGERLEQGRLIGAETLLRAATMGGARALGIDASVGSLEEGRQADLAVFSLEGVHQRPIHDVAAALLFASSARDCRLTVVAGKEIFREGRITTVDEAGLRARVDEIARRLGDVKL